MSNVTKSAFRIRELKAQHDMAFDGGWPVGQLAMLASTIA
jgi:hypothetical protein